MQRIFSMTVEIKGKSKLLILSCFYEEKSYCFSRREIPSFTTSENKVVRTTLCDELFLTC